MPQATTVMEYIMERIINMNEIKTVQYNLLNQLKLVFEENSVPTVLRSAGEADIPMDILTTLHREFGMDLDEVMGEFYFLPTKDGGTIHYFTSMISLTEDMDPEFVPAVAEAVRVLNFYLECGAFVMNPTGNLLAFKLVTPVPVSYTTEQLLELININAGHALQITERYVDNLLRLSDGRHSLEHFMEMMPQV